MEWWEELYKALGDVPDTSGLDAGIIAAGSDILPSYLPTDYSNFDSAMMAAGSTALPYGGASSCKELGQPLEAYRKPTQAHAQPGHK